MAKEQLILTRYIRDIPDWPKKGILFRDITPLLGDPRRSRPAIDALCEPFKRAGVKYVAAIEARGFIFGAAVAARLRAGFVPIRKKGKLPCADGKRQLRAGVRHGLHRNAPRRHPGAATRSCWSTTCSPPAARCTRPANSWRKSAPRLSASPSSSSWPTCKAADGWPRTRSTR